MTRYLISIADGALGVSEERLPDVADAAHEGVQEAKDAGVWVFGIGEPSSSPVPGYRRRSCRHLASVHNTGIGTLRIVCVHASQVMHQEAAPEP